MKNAAHRHQKWPAGTIFRDREKTSPVTSEDTVGYDHDGKLMVKTEIEQRSFWVPAIMISSVNRRLGEAWQMAG